MTDPNTLKGDRSERATSCAPGDLLLRLDSELPAVILGVKVDKTLVREFILELEQARDLAFKLNCAVARLTIAEFDRKVLGDG